MDFYDIMSYFGKHDKLSKFLFPKQIMQEHGIGYKFFSKIEREFNFLDRNHLI